MTFPNCIPANSANSGNYCLQCITTYLNEHWISWTEFQSLPIEVKEKIASWWITKIDMCSLDVFADGLLYFDIPYGVMGIEG